MNAEEVIEQIRVIVFDEDVCAALRMLGSLSYSFDRTAEEGYIYDALNDIQTLLLEI